VPAGRPELRVLLHTGKGGVGKTTLAACTALGAARHGHRVFLLSADPAHSVGDVLGRELSGGPVEIAPGVVAQEWAVLDELDRAWSEIQTWLRELVGDLDEALVSEELFVLPGLEELVALRAIREVEATGDYDLCVVDCAPTGSTLRLLRFPDVLRFFMEHFFDWKRRTARVLRPVMASVRGERFVPSEAVFDAVERLYDDVACVRQILLDNDRTSARLILNPARIVVDESRRAFSYLCLYGVATDAVLVNRELPRDAASGFFARWAARESLMLDEIERSFPLPLLHVPLQPSEPIGVEALGKLASEVFGDRDPAERMSEGRPIRLAKRGSQTVLRIDLPHVADDELCVESAGGELLIRARDAQRLLSLPDSLAGRDVLGTRLEAGVLEVVFGP